MYSDNNLTENKKDRSNTYYSIIITLILLGLLVMVLVPLFLVINSSKIQGWFSSRVEQVAYEVAYKIVIATLEDPDKDSDGISNIDEINIYGTDPKNNDSNNNGVSDGKEIYNIFRKNVLNKNSEELLLYRKNISEKGIVSLEEIFESYGVLTYNFYIGIHDEKVKEKVKESLALRGEKKFQESINLLEKALKDNANYKWIINYHIGLSYHGMENFKKALEYYEGLLENKDAINPLLYQDIAAVSYGLGDELKYVEYLQKSIKEFPEYLEVYPRLARYYSEKDNSLAAKEILEKGIEIEPRYSALYNDLGFIYKLQGNTSKALEYYKIAVEMDFHNAISHMNISVLYRDNFNKPDEALVEAVIANELNPNSDRINNNLGDSYLRRGEYSNAITYLKKASELSPNWFLPHQNLGFVYLNMGNKDNAIREWEIAISLGMTNEKALQILENIKK